MENFTTIHFYYTLSLSLLLFSIILSSLELSFIPSHYLNFVYPKLDELQVREKKWLGIHFIQIICAFTSGYFFFTENQVPFNVFFFILTVATFYSYKERTVSKGGSDQLRMISLMTFNLCFLLDDVRGELITLFFLGLQALLAYSTSGIAKLLSSYWRKGNVLHLIFGTYSYGIPQLSLFFKNRPNMERFTSHSAIFIMLIVPISFFVPNPTILYLALLCILSFHLATAIIMGLNDFLFTFPLAYPGILLLHGLLYNYI